MDSYLTLSRVSEGSPVLQFSIFASLAIKLPPVIFFPAAGLSYSSNVYFSFLPAAANSSSFSFHLSPCFATCIQVWLFLTSLPLVASVSSGLKKSCTSSSHLFLSLPTALHVLILVLNLGFQFSNFPYPSFFWWRCYSHRQSPFHSSVHLDRTRNLDHPHSISLSESSAKETSLSWSQSVSVLLPSCVSLSEFSWLSFLSQCLFSDFHVACHLFFFLYFLLVGTMGRSIFRFAKSINLSCSFLKVHVPHAQPNVGESTIFNKRNLCCRGYDLDVNSCCRTTPKLLGFCFCCPSFLVAEKLLFVQATSRTLAQVILRP